MLTLADTVGGPFSLDRSEFNKPTYVITGDKDAPFCASDCQVTSLGEGKTQLDTAKDLYPGVADGDFETYAVPLTGHAINFRKFSVLAPCSSCVLMVVMFADDMVDPSSYDAYQKIIKFVTSHMD